MCYFLLEISALYPAIKLTFGRNKFGRRTVYNLQARVRNKFGRKDIVQFTDQITFIEKVIKSLTNFIYQNVSPMEVSSSNMSSNLLMILVMSNCNLLLRWYFEFYNIGISKCFH